MGELGRWVPTWWQGWHWRWIPSVSEWRPLKAYPAVWRTVGSAKGSWVGSSGMAIKNGFASPQEAAKWAMSEARRG